MTSTHLPCPCGKSSDAYTLYDDHGFCFSCSRVINFNASVDKLNTKPFAWRGVSVKTLEVFGVTGTYVDNEPYEIIYPYDTGSKVRRIKDKFFYAKDDMNGPKLYGKQLWESGSAKAVTITEGELDAMSVYEMLGHFPVVSVKSSVTAHADCADPDNFKFLDSFETIVLAFDNDEPGRAATRKVASLFPFNKVKVLDFNNLKDANDFLQRGMFKEFKSLWFNAKRLMRDDVISDFGDIKKALEDAKIKPSVPFPFKVLQDQTFGIRTGEVLLLTAQEGIGKTEVLRAIEYHLLQNTDSNLGIIHLEEPKDRSIKGIAGYFLNAPTHLPTSKFSLVEIFDAYSKAVKKNDRLHIYTHYGSEDPDDLLGAIRFLVSACGCKYIFLDHITMVVTGLNDSDERKLLDYLSTRLAMLTKELDFAMIMVSHVNDDDKTRGSRNISKVADIHIKLERDKLSEDVDIRNTTKLTIVKNRPTSITGPSSQVQFNVETFRIEDKVVEIGVPA